MDSYEYFEIYKESQSEYRLKSTPFASLFVIAAIGELQIPDSEKKSFKSHLISGWAKILYTCRISQNDEKAKINDRLRVTVWVKELKEKTEIKKTSKNKKEVETKP